MSSQQNDIPRRKYIQNGGCFRVHQSQEVVCQFISFILYNRRYCCTVLGWRAFKESYNISFSLLVSATPKVRRHYSRHMTGGGRGWMQAECYASTKTLPCCCMYISIYSIRQWFWQHKIITHVSLTWLWVIKKGGCTTLAKTLALIPSQAPAEKFSVIWPMGTTSNLE